MTKEYKLISVIVPCFNSGKILKRAVDSVLKQTWPAIEIVIVNDGSFDKQTLETFKYCKKFSNLKLINQNNLGLSAARNNGVKNANGEYLFFLDSDDWIEPETLEMMYLFLLKNNSKAFVFSDIILEGKICKLIEKNYNFFEQLFINQIPYSILISKKIWIQNGGYDEYMKHGYEDWDFNIRLGSSQLYGARLSEPFFHYNVSDSGMLISKSSKSHAEIWKYIIDKNKKLYSFGNIMKLWINWRRKASTYPLIIFIVWYLIFKIIPKPLFSKLFIIFRNIKWFFTRNNTFLI